MKIKRILAILLCLSVFSVSEVTAFAGTGSFAGYEGSNGMPVFTSVTGEEYLEAEAEKEAAALKERQAAAETAEKAFSDVKAADWFSYAVGTAASKGLISGYPDGSFRPDKTVTYGEFLAMCAARYPSSNRGSHWASAYYNGALAMGYFTEGRISADDLDKPIPRKDMALLLSGMVRLHLTSASVFPVYEYTDVVQGTDESYHISVCSSMGLLSGYTDGSFRPEAYLKRSEAASVIAAYAEKIGQSMNIPLEQHDKLEDEDTAGLIREDHMTILRKVCESAGISGTPGNYSFTYDQPEIPEYCHFAADLHIYRQDGSGGDATVFFENSDAGWIMHPENYDPAAHRVDLKLNGVKDLNSLAVVLRFEIYDVLDPLNIIYGEGANLTFCKEYDGTFERVEFAHRYYRGELKTYHDHYYGCERFPVFCWQQEVTE